MKSLIVTTGNLFILTLVISCSKQEASYETDLLHQTLEEAWITNTRIISNIQAEVEKRGYRNSDVLVLQKAEIILDHRKKYGIPAIANIHTSLKGLNPYLDFLDSIRIAHEYQVIDATWKHHRNAIDHFKNEIDSEYGTKDALNVMLYLTYLERELITELAEMVGNSCWFGIGFNYHCLSDSARIGEEFEMIVTPDYNPEPGIDVSYGPAILMVDKDSIYDFELEVIGSAAYLRFLPERPGTYFFNAGFEFTDFDYTYSNPVVKQIIVY